MDFDLSTFDTIHTQSNIFGGEDFHSVIGSIIATSQPDIFGGVDINMNLSQNSFVSDIPDFKL